MYMRTLGVPEIGYGIWLRILTGSSLRLRLVMWLALPNKKWMEMTNCYFQKYLFRGIVFFHLTFGKI